MNKEEEIGQAVLDIIGPMAHDVLSPASTALNYLDLVKEILKDSKDSELKEYLAAIESSLTLSTKILMTYQNTASILYHNETPKMGEVELEPFMQNIYKTGLLLKSKHGKDLNFNFSFNTKAKSIYTNQAYLEIILQNYLTNAFKYVQKGKEITLGAKDYNQNTVKIFVQDTGQGISQEKIPSLFDKYVQSREEDGKKGTGLGLYTVQKISNILNMPYGVKSEPWLNTEFYILPKLKSEVSK